MKPVFVVPDYNLVYYSQTINTQETVEEEVVNSLTLAHMVVSTYNVTI